MASGLVQILVVSCVFPSFAALWKISYTDCGLEVCPTCDAGEDDRTCEAILQRVQCHTFSYLSLKRRFPDKFMTQEQFAELSGLPYRDIIDEDPTQPIDNDQLTQRRKRDTHCDGYNGLSDKDMCCETCRYFTNVNEITNVVTTVNGNPCYVISCPGINEYQFIPTGHCIGGNCEGECLPQTTIHSVVCAEVFRWKFKFRIGHLNATSYCSCQNVGG